MLDMSKSDLAAKYGKSKNENQLVNAAIRAELVAGNEALDALDQLRRLEERSQSRDAAEGLAAVKPIVEAMAAEIRKRYGLQ